MYYSIIRFTFEYSTAMHILSLNFDGIEESRHASVVAKVHTVCSPFTLHITSSNNSIRIWA